MREILFFLLVGSATACNGSPPGDSGGDAGTPDACAPSSFDAAAYVSDGASAVIGTPCLPSSERNPTFTGFSLGEVSLDGVPPSAKPACLIYYFRGLVTCPYGESADGQVPECASPCTTIAGEPIAGQVAAECANRPASKAVFWSCRCADAEGNTSNDSYCTCPSGMACVPVFSSFGAEDERSGSYCIPPGIVPDAGPACSTPCDPTTRPCH